MSAPMPFEAATAGPGSIELRGVGKRFGGVVAAADVTLSVPVGRVCGLIGPNGAGKSTTISLISGFLRPDAGEIRFGAEELTRLSPTAIARLGIARTFQQAAPLTGLSVLDNVMAGMHMRHRSTIAAVLLRLPAMRREMSEVDAAARDLLDAFGLGAEAEADAGDLTFGKLRFLEIARAVATRPRILLLDEPAAGLNTVETARLAELIRDLRRGGMGILLVDHDVPFVFELCDEVTVMNFGSIIAAGSPDEVYRNPEVREAYLGDRDTGTKASP